MCEARAEIQRRSDAVFVGDTLAIALENRVLLLDARGCPSPVELGPFEGVLGLGRLDGTLMVIDRGDRTLRRFRTDGVELAPPALVEGAGSSPPSEAPRWWVMKDLNLQPMG